jgi:HlyD family secretion protein
MAAVHDADSAPWVLRLEGHRAIRRPVTLGLRGAGVAEVLAGLAEGDAVLAEAVSVKSGARVRTTAPVAIHATSALK